MEGTTTLINAKPRKICESENSKYADTCVNMDRVISKRTHDILQKIYRINACSAGIFMDYFFRYFVATYYNIQFTDIACEEVKDNDISNAYCVLQGSNDVIGNIPALLICSSAHCIRYREKFDDRIAEYVLMLDMNIVEYYEHYMRELFPDENTAFFNMKVGNMSECDIIIGKYLIELKFTNGTNYYHEKQQVLDYHSHISGNNIEYGGVLNLYLRTFKYWKFIPKISDWEMIRRKTRGQKR